MRGNREGEEGRGGGETGRDEGDGRGWKRGGGCVSVKAKFASS